MTIRAERTGSHRAAYDANRKKIIATQNICAICGNPVDHSLKYPNPMSAAIDHIIPVSKNGHPSDINNLQLAHMTCNRQKSDKTFANPKEVKVLGNRNLPQSLDWASYRSEAGTQSTHKEELPKKSTVIRVKRKVR